MNKIDLEYMKLILTMNPAELEEWFAYATPQEHAYAMTLLTGVSAALDEYLDTDQMADLSAAKQILGKFTLKGCVK